MQKIYPELMGPVISIPEILKSKVVNPELLLSYIRRSANIHPLVQSAVNDVKAANLTSNHYDFVVSGSGAGNWQLKAAFGIDLVETLADVDCAAIINEGMENQNNVLNSLESSLREKLYQIGLVLCDTYKPTQAFVNLDIQASTEAFKNLKTFQDKTAWVMRIYVIAMYSPQHQEQIISMLTDVLASEGLDLNDFYADSAFQKIVKREIDRNSLTKSKYINQIKAQKNLDDNEVESLKEWLAANGRKETRAY